MLRETTLTISDSVEIVSPVKSKIWRVVSLSTTNLQGLGTSTLSKTTNFRLFQTERDNNFKFDENGRKLSKKVENTVGNGEIARYEQFLLFQQCFQKACFPEVSKGVIVWEWVNPFQNNKF